MQIKPILDALSKLPPEVLESAVKDTTVPIMELVNNSVEARKGLVYDLGDVIGHLIGNINLLLENELANKEATILVDKVVKSKRILFEKYTNSGFTDDQAMQFVLQQFKFPELPKSKSKE